MSIFQLIEHCRAYTEKLDILSIVFYKRAIFCIDIIPIETLLVEKAIVLVDGFPELVEVGYGVVDGIEMRVVDTRVGHSC